jgi:hypothetical protein
MPSEQDLVRIGEQQRFESQRATVEAKLQTGQPLDIYESIFLSHYYPDVSKQMARPMYGPAKPVSQEQQQPPPSYTELRRQEYKGFGSEYVAPLVRETEVEGKPSLAESLLNVKVTPVFASVGLKTMSADPLVNLGLKQPTGKPFAVVGGVIAPFETVGYVLGRAVGLKTPNLPPLLSAETPEYSVGYVLGEVGLLLASTFAIGKVAEGLGKVGRFLEEKTKLKQTVVQSPIGQKAIAIGEKLPSRPKFTGSGAEEWLIEHSDVYREHAEKTISPGIVDVPDIGYVSPRTMSEKVLGLPELESPYPLKGMQPIEAEAGAMSFADVPRTMILDPQVSGALENPVTRQIFSLPSGLPFLDVGSVERASFLPQAIGLATVIGIQVGASQIGKGTIKTELPTRSLPKLESFTTVTPSLKSIVDLGSDVSLSPILASEASPIQGTMQEPILKTIQIPRTVQVPRTVQMGTPSFVQLKTPIFDRELPYMPKMDMFISKRKGKSPWAKRYMWEFPVKGAKEVWKVL